MMAVAVEVQVQVGGFGRGGLRRAHMSGTGKAQFLALRLPGKRQVSTVSSRYPSSTGKRRPRPGGGPRRGSGGDALVSGPRSRVSTDSSVAGVSARGPAAAESVGQGSRADVAGPS
jgi:hypothetical protein